MDHPAIDTLNRTARRGGGGRPTRPDRVWSAIQKSIIRIYALAILIVVLWTGYAATGYLFETVFSPARLPPRFRAGQTRLTVGALRAPASEAAERTAVGTPLGHYHRVGRWFHADPHNGCTTRGCHDPLPHTKRKAIRAFANLHATFLACRMCHDANLSGPAQAVWISTATGERQAPPAMLALLRALECSADQILQRPHEIHPTLLDLLRTANRVIGGDPVLTHLAVRLETAEPGSPVWRQTLEQLKQELPSHARGEYGAKLALLRPDEEVRRAARRLAEQTRQYLESAPNSRRREPAYQRIHADVLEQPGGCLACHGARPPRLDLASLGYPPARAAYLLSSPVARRMQQIQQGEPFHLPEVPERRDAP